MNGRLVRAANHQEVTLAVAALLSGAELARALAELAGTRRLRADLEYGWRAGASHRDGARALEIVGRILRLGAGELAGRRPPIRERLHPS